MRDASRQSLYCSSISPVDCGADDKQAGHEQSGTATVGRQSCQHAYSVWGPPLRLHYVGGVVYSDDIIDARAVLAVATCEF